MKSDDNVPAARGNVTREAVAAKSRQKGSIAAIKDSVAPTSEEAALATPGDARSAQVASDIGHHR